MRDPALNGETKSYNDIRLKINGEERTEEQGDDISSGPRIRPKSSARLNGTYEELYRLQNGDLENNSDAANPATVSFRRGRPAALQRVRSDMGPQDRAERINAMAEENLLHMRHGWHDEYTSNEYLSLLNSVCICGFHIVL